MTEQQRCLLGAAAIQAVNLAAFLAGYLKVSIPLSIVGLLSFFFLARWFTPHLLDGMLVLTGSWIRFPPFHIGNVVAHLPAMLVATHLIEGKALLDSTEVILASGFAVVFGAILCFGMWKAFEPLRKTKASERLLGKTRAEKQQADQQKGGRARDLDHGVDGRAE